jgi:hypothetical protein
MSLFLILLYDFKLYYSMVVSLLRLYSTDYNKWMSVVYQGNNTNKVKLKYLEKSLLQYHFVHHKTYTDWPGIEARCPSWKNMMVDILSVKIKGTGINGVLKISSWVTLYTHSCKHRHGVQQ